MAKKYRLIKVPNALFDIWRVERKFLGIWWKVRSFDMEAMADRFAEDCINPKIKEYN